VSNLYGLIGFPLGHSFSKKYFNEKFEKESLGDCFFELFPIAQIDLFPSLLLEQPSLQGLAVTIPYKKAVIPYLHQLDAAAQNTGAVNCIQFNEGKLKGFNTDIIGFERSFAPLLQPHHTKALILGTGGSSKAVLYTLNKLNIPFKIVSRTPKENEIGYNDIDQQLLEEYTIIINCTPVGMTPNVDAAPQLPYQFIGNRHYCYDLIYTPAETKFLRLAKSCGATIMNGYDMLLIQAEENWKIWNEPANPEGVEQ
jgi:shikimate dehydrogenase